MAILEGYKHNFDTLVEAVKAGDICILECEDKVTQKPVIAVCALNFDGEEYTFVPVAKLFDGNPYDELNPPAPKGGFERE